MPDLWNWIAQFYAVLAMIPFFSFMLFWFIVYTLWKDKKKATAIAMDITTALLIGSVSVMFNKIFTSAYGIWLILLMFLIAGGLLGGAQNRLKGRIDVKRIAKGLWRFGFLMLSLFYIVFLLIGISKSVFEV